MIQAGQLQSKATTSIFTRRSTLFRSAGAGASRSARSGCSRASRTRSGRWRKRASAVNTKAAARELAAELEFHVRRQRAGLEPLPAKDGGGTLGDLLTWWLATYSRGTPSHEHTEYTVRKHLLRSELAAVRLQEMTSGQVERFLQAKVGDYSPQTVDHLRRFILTAFNCARRAGRWLGPNPASDVRQRKVHRRAFDYLRAAEVPRMLAALHPRWRPLFATAVYTGLRRSELRGLRKRDVDLEAGLLTVARSGDRDLTKGGHADTIPIATELVP